MRSIKLLESIARESRRQSRRSSKRTTQAINSAFQYLRPDLRYGISDPLSMYGIESFIFVQGAIPTYDAVLPRPSDMLKIPTAADSLSEVLSKLFAMSKVIASGKSVAQMAGLTGTTLTTSESELDLAEFQCLERMMNVLSPKLKAASTDIKNGCSTLSKSDLLLLDRAFRLEKKLKRLFQDYYRVQKQLGIGSDSGTTMATDSLLAANAPRQSQEKAVAAPSHESSEAGPQGNDWKLVKKRRMTGSKRQI